MWQPPWHFLAQAQGRIKRADLYPPHLLPDDVLIVIVCWSALTIRQASGATELVIDDWDEVFRAPTRPAPIGNMGPSSIVSCCPSYGITTRLVSQSFIGYRCLVNSRKSRMLITLQRKHHELVYRRARP